MIPIEEDQEEENQETYHDQVNYEDNLDIIPINDVNEQYKQGHQITSEPKDIKDTVNISFQDPQ